MDGENKEQTSEHFRVAHAFSERGIYLGEVRAWRDPRAPENFLLPANATFDAPVYDPETETVLRIGEVWETCPRTARLFYNIETGEKLSVIDHPSQYPDPAKFSEEKPAILLEQEKRAELQAKVAPLYQRVQAQLLEANATPEELAALKELQGLK